MSILSDKEIIDYIDEYEMISPFHDVLIKEDKGKKVVSYGLSSYGYDLRVADSFKVFTNVNNSIVDPKEFSYDAFVEVKGDVCIVPPNSFALAVSVEYFKIPITIMCKDCDSIFDSNIKFFYTCC